MPIEKLKEYFVARVHVEMGETPEHIIRALDDGLRLRKACNEKFRAIGESDAGHEYFLEAVESIRELVRSNMDYCRLQSEECDKVYQTQPAAHQQSYNPVYPYGYQQAYTTYPYVYPQAYHQQYVQYAHQYDAYSQGYTGQQYAQSAQSYAQYPYSQI